MKKLFIALAAALLLALFAGCQIAKSPQDTPPAETVTPDPYAGWNTYVDPQGEFTLRYPLDWTQTEAKDEVQFWDNFDDGRNSIKMSLTTEPINTTEPNNPNNKEVIIARGTSLNTPYERYEYPFETFTLSLTALFNDDTPELRELATKVQESINFTTQP